MLTLRVDAEVLSALKSLARRRKVSLSVFLRSVVDDSLSSPGRGLQEGRVAPLEGFGVPSGGESRSKVTVTAAGANARKRPCFCGSGRQYRYCHGRPSPFAF